MLEQPRTTQRRVAHVASDEPRLIRRMVQLASGYGRYGYRKVTALLREEGWQVNHKRIERLWRQEGLKIPQRQPKPELRRPTIEVLSGKDPRYLIYN